ncbi:ATP-grasp domain-containing protein [Streptomyces violaceorubidus]
MTAQNQTVLLLEPESSGLDLIKAAARLGFRVHIFDHRPLEELGAAARQAVNDKTADYRRVDVRATHTAVAAAKELSARTPLSAVIPGFEYAVPAAAAIAAALALPGLDPQDAEALREKDLMKTRLQEAGVAVAAGVSFDLAQAAQATREFARTVGFPAVIKPVDGSGSLLVRRVDNAAQLNAYLELCRRGPVDSMGRPMGAHLLLERYVPGAEYSVEGYVSGHDVTVVAVTQKQLGAEPDFAELGHIVDAPLGAAERHALEATATAAVRALGLTLGVFHLEARLADDGPVVMEIGARLPGDRIPVLVSQVHGVDLAQTMIRCHTGLPLSPAAPRPRARVAASQFFTVETASTLPNPDLLARQLSTLEGCVEAVVTCEPGALLLPATDWRQRFGRLIVTASDRARLETVLADAHHLIRTAVRVHDR